MSRARLLSLLPALALVVGFVAVAQPAEAAARPKITVKASSKAVAINGSVTLTGKVSGTSRGAKVTLQRRSGGTWKSVGSTKVRKNKTFRFTVTISDTKTTFRAKVAKNNRSRSATSKTVQVTGMPAAAPAPPSADDPVRVLILQKTNEFRIANGRAPLAMMPELNSIAQEWSTYMATTSDFKHRPSFTDPYPKGWRGAAENIAAGQSPETVVDSWIASPGHRKNLLGDYNYIGIGYATGGAYGRYYTQNFARY